MTDSVGATCTGLEKKYRRGDPALTDVDLQIHAGEITGLLGRNGSGKTTLMRLLGGELFPSSGKVQIDGH
ncbi:ATP-binding cassette domain-containing protein, partial [Bacillus cereus]|uniref:ATP-binding cassette domain-containing protein n=1 Tax=Bacillus cereus TaxID=1396 RepID=UPI0028460963